MVQSCKTKVYFKIAFACMVVMSFVTCVYASNSKGYDAVITSTSSASLSSGSTKLSPGFHTSIVKFDLTGTEMLVETKVSYKILLTTKNALGYNTINQNSSRNLLEWDLGGKYAIKSTWSRVSGGSMLSAEFGYYNW